MSEQTLMPLGHAESAQLQTVAQQVLAHAKQRGASSAEVSASLSIGLATTVRLGEVETMSFHRDKGVGVTVYFGHRKGSASTSDTRPEAVAETVRVACEMAKYTAEDSYAGLAERELLATEFPDLDLNHPWALSPEHAISLAKSCEDVARADQRITNSEGASVNTGQGIQVYANSHGFMASTAGTRHGLSCVLIAGKDDNMQRDYWYTTSRDAQCLESAEYVAKRAVERTVNRLQARKLKTCRSPVIFAAEVAGGLLGSLISAISGGNLYRQSSFLLNALGKTIFPASITITENPLLLKGMGSAAFDSEGVKTRQRALVKEGVLESYVLSSYSARKLGLQTTGNAGGVHNLTISTTQSTLSELLKDMGTGLLVTELMGQGVNIVTGDYSRGAAGFWIENGEIQYPVEEITIASNLKDIFLNCQTVGNDIDRRGNILTGSWLISDMMIAGE